MTIFLTLEIMLNVSVFIYDDVITILSANVLIQFKTDCGFLKFILRTCRKPHE